MSLYSKETYSLMLDNLLSAELSFNASSATPANIKMALKRVLGTLIRQGLLKGYAFLVLDDSLNVHVTIIDADSTEFDILLEYGK